MLKKKLSIAAKKRQLQIVIDNKKFSKMSMPKKRVQIAKDVLAQLESKRLEPKAGVWILGKDEAQLKVDLNADVQLQSVFKTQEKCVGCALGGIFMCAVERANKLKVCELSTNYYGEWASIEQEQDIFTYLKRYFTPTQLDQIEHAFEAGERYTVDDQEGNEEEDDMYYNDLRFVNDISDFSIRMRLIMENIIVNKGEFNPLQKPKQVINWITPGY